MEPEYQKTIIPGSVTHLGKNDSMFHFRYSASKRTPLFALHMRSKGIIIGNRHIYLAAWCP